MAVAGEGSYDVKRARRELYGAKAGRFDVVEVPPMRFLMADGRGDPNTSADYRAVLEALYPLSYAVRAVCRAELGRVHTVAPLEGLWYADDPRVFTARSKDEWRWTMMIAQPEWVTAELVAAALERVTATTKTKTTTTTPAAVDKVVFREFAEGTAVQTLHVGPYDDEGPTIARMHEEVIPSRGFVPSGHHHEIYLSDARRTDPARLRTILRQPVAPAPSAGATGRQER